MAGGPRLILGAGRYFGDVREHVVAVHAYRFPVHGPLRFAILKLSSQSLHTSFS